MSSNAGLKISDKRKAAWRVALRETYKKSLFATAKYLCNFTDINEHTHGDVIKALEEPTKRKLIVMPRGTFKSSIGCVAYPIWLLINDPNKRILIDSEVYTNSKAFVSQIKGIVESERFTSIFGKWTGMKWAEGAITVGARTSLSIKESSVQASGIGATKVGQHYDVIICDDMNSDKNSATEEGLKKVIAHYRMNISILEPNGTLAVIGTRYSASDLIGHIVSNEITPQKGEQNANDFGTNG